MLQVSVAVQSIFMSMDNDLTIHFMSMLVFFRLYEIMNMKWILTSGGATGGYE